MDHGILSLAPAALAIVLAVVTRNVIVSLFSAVAFAGMIHRDALWGGIVHSVESTMVGAIADADHAKTMLFTVLIGATVGVIGRSGATRAVVEALARRAKSRRSVEILSWLAGLVVFFDDYANCMIVGSAMAPLCDRHKVSRAKLAYIVDSTAAPVASLALVSTWVGYEVGVIDEGLKIAQVKFASAQVEAYGFFVQGWAYRFYPILALVFVGMIAVTGRDFGPMRTESGAIEHTKSGDKDEEEVSNAPWWAAALPIIVLVGMTLFVLWTSGKRESAPGAAMFEVLAQADGYGAILQGSFTALLLAIGLALVTRALSLKQTTDAALRGMTIMFEALVVLVLAWSLSTAMKELHAPEYLVGALRTTLPPALLPSLTFVVGAVISFAVGSSYTTMGIMMPMVVPLSFELSPHDLMIPLASSGSVLAGACFGDHCSPISDTTVLSAIGSGSELLAHVRTQLPYALLIGGISVVFGTLPAGYGANPWLCLLLASVASYVALRLFGKPAAVPAGAAMDAPKAGEPDEPEPKPEPADS